MNRFSRRSSALRTSGLRPRPSKDSAALPGALLRRPEAGRSARHCKAGASKRPADAATRRARGATSGRLDLDGLANLLPRDGIAVLVEAYLSAGEADALLDALTAKLVWEQRTITVYGGTCDVPRLTAWCGEMAYTCSGITDAADRNGSAPSLRRPEGTGSPGPVAHANRGSSSGRRQVAQPSLPGMRTLGIGWPPPTRAPWRA